MHNATPLTDLATVAELVIAGTEAEYDVRGLFALKAEFETPIGRQCITDVLQLFVSSKSNGALRVQKLDDGARRMHMRNAMAFRIIDQDGSTVRSFNLGPAGNGLQYVEE